MVVIMKLSSSDKFYIQSINRAFSLIEEIGRSGDAGISLTELSERTGLHISTAYRILQNLISWQYIKEGSDSRFRLGLELITLGNIAGGSIGLKNTAHQYLAELGNLTRETIYLAILDEDRADVMYIDKIESKGNIKLAAGIGSRNCIHSTANGKVLLSGLGDERIKALLDKVGMPSHTDATITVPDLLLSEISRVRAQGYAIDNLENEPGVRCIAAPIYDNANRICGSISLSGISTSVTFELIEEKYKTMIIETACNISSKLGYKA